MRLGNKQQGGEWRAVFEGEEVVWRFARPSTPALLELEAHTAPLEAKRIKLRQMLIRRGEVVLNLTEATLRLKAMQHEQHEPSEQTSALAQEVSALAQRTGQLDMDLLEERINAQDLQPHYGFALAHTLSVSPLLDESGEPIAWEALEHAEKLGLLEQLSQAALIEYCDTICLSASLGHAKKKHSEKHLPPTSSPPASAMFAQERPTPKKAKGKNTTASSRGSRQT